MASGDRGKPNLLVRAAGYKQPEFPLSDRALGKYEEIVEILGVKKNLYSRMVILDLAIERLHTDLTSKKKVEKYKYDGHVYDYFLKRNSITLRALNRMVGIRNNDGKNKDNLVAKLDLAKDIIRYINK